MLRKVFIKQSYDPLADRLRPKDISDFIDQSHLLADRHPLRQAIMNNTPHSMILWGPSEVGKTTLARIICQQADGFFIQLSTVLDGIKPLGMWLNVLENTKILVNRRFYSCMRYENILTKLFFYLILKISRLFI